MKVCVAGRLATVASELSHVPGLVCLQGCAVAKPSSSEVQLDRRAKSDRRSGEDRRKQNLPVAVERRQGERRAKVPRRRQIDPTTCERDYTPDEIEFMQALDAYKRASGRMFPTCSEILEVIRSLGYVKLPKDSQGADPSAIAQTPAATPTAQGNTPA